jgi:hypothetical protein
MTVCIIDTTVFCEILRVPNMCSDPQITGTLKAKVIAREELMLPMTTILETGNHIGQNGDGGARRKAADRFVKEVTSAIEGKTPFTATAFLEREKLTTWLGKFPDWAARVDGRGKGSGLGDLTIYEEWCELCEKFPGRRVYIWSLDAQLAAYDRKP